MRLSTIASVAACCASAQAFSDTSPFLLFSTSKFSQSYSQEQLQTDEQVLSSANGFLASCPTTRYLLVAQPNLNAAHLRSSSAAPKLQRALKRSKIQGRLSIAEVEGEIDLQGLAKFVKSACAGKKVFVDQIVLDPIPASGSSAALQESDDDLAIVLDQYELEDSYTIIYTAGPKGQATAETSHYEPEFQQGYHQELKRQLSLKTRSSGGINSTTKLPLFEKYQFFTPGIFMSLIVLAVLVSILGVGISALASLEVSYGAFDKENGPSAQKKPQ